MKLRAYFGTMPGVLLALALGLSQAGAPVATYAEPRAGVQLSYPTAWNLKKNKRGGGVLTMTLPGGGQATVALNTSTYRGTVEEWEALQKQVAEQGKRTFREQDDQELLGVPLVLTAVDYSEGVKERTALTGLLYTRTNEKFTFILVADRDAFADARVVFQPVLESLRTFDGAAPKPETPGATIDPKAEIPAKPTPPPTRPRVFPDDRNRAPDQDFVSPPFKIGERSAVVLGSDELQIATEGSVTTVRRGDAALALTLSLPADAASPTAALVGAANEELALFDTVAVREDGLFRKNRAGANVATVLRRGTKGGSEKVRLLVLLDATDLYGLAQLEWPSFAAYRKDRKAVLDLIDRVSLRLEP